MKIAIAGYGLEGESNYRYWSSLGHDVTIVDESKEPKRPLPVGAKVRMGEGVFEDLFGYDMVVRTAGLAPHKIRTDGKIWSSTNEFFARCRTPIIGVTGTKGKGTTASLIESILIAGGKKTMLLGNIGRPALESLDEANRADVIVYEMSSFQLWDLERSPHIAVVLMIEADHLNVHTGMEDYVMAKANIRRHQGQGDYCYYHPTNEYSRQIANTGDWFEDEYEEREWRANAMHFSDPNGGGAYVKENTFFVRDQLICPVDTLRIPGEHNVMNACAAISATYHYVIDPEQIAEGLRRFEGLPHRLELVREVDGVRYYNDSFSSAPGATVAAVKSFEGPQILILGGIDKGADFSELAHTLKESPQVKHLFLIGSIKQKLADYLQARGVTTELTILDETEMAEIVRCVASVADEGDTVILSPACASFDMFRDFYERGDLFREAVNQL